MNDIFGDFIISEEKRSNELKIIQNFVDQSGSILSPMLKNKIGHTNSYITFDHAMEANLIRGPYQIYPIGFVRNKIGFVYLPNECDVSYVNRYMHGISDMEKMGVRDWVLDFRGNVGGIFAYFLNLILPFLPEKIESLEENLREQFIETTDSHRHFNSFNEQHFLHARNKIDYDSLTVQINEHSYSSSEYCAYLLRKHSKAKIIGHKSGGALNSPRHLHTIIGDCNVPGTTFNVSEQFVIPDDFHYINF